ncbi:MAG: hypothetical protein P8X90_09045 [Desulfobacterales bacterium]
MPLSIARVLPSTRNELIGVLESELGRDNDVVLCFNSRRLFGAGDLEHAALIEAFDKSSGLATVVDPAIGAPKRRIITVDDIFHTIRSHRVSELGGLWIISE